MFDFTQSLLYTSKLSNGKSKLLSKIRNKIVSSPDPESQVSGQ